MPTAARRRRCALATVLAALAVFAPTASLAKSPRSLAVVEFRSGSSAAPDIGARTARMLTLKTGLGIMAPAAARQEYGPRLDQVVKRCGADAACLAKLGKALGVDEILLLGLSELGDVILTMQRVVIASGRIEGSTAETLAPGAKLSDADLEKLLRRVLPDADFEQWGTIKIESNVSKATVSIAGEKRGVTPLAPVSVRAPASYDVEVGKSGYSDFRASIAVTPNALVVVKPELTPLPRDAWYKKWWVLTIAGVVTASAVGTAIFIARDDPTDVPVMVDPF